MIFIGENIHILSKRIKEALINRDENFIINLINQLDNTEYLDLNVGPSKGELAGTLKWLCGLVKKVRNNEKISIDTTNIDEIKMALNVIASKSDIFLNSTSNDEPKLSNMIELARDNNCKLIALTMSKESGVPKTADERLEIAFEIYERAVSLGMDTANLFFDPLILPIAADQAQATQAINTIKMLKESFDSPIKTIVGISNISNGCPGELRPLINKVMSVLCYGAGLDAIIADAEDSELIMTLKNLESNSLIKNNDNIYDKLVSMIENFEDIEEVKFNIHDSNDKKIIETAKMLLGKIVYSTSFLNI